MAFFDKLSKSVTESSQKTIAKAKALADTSRLNTMIYDQEKIINNQYFQIGKLYVSVHGTDYEDDFAGMIGAIADAEAQIKDFKRQIQELKDVRRCEKCGAEVPDGAAFCSSCGATMPRAQVSEPADCVKCENCGAYVKKGMRFCTFCGKPMEAVAAPAAKEPEVADAPAAKETEAADPAAEKLCPNCGAKVDGEVSFCTECGEKL